MSNPNPIFPPRRDDPADRCHILFHQIHSLLTILIHQQGQQENHLCSLLQQMVEELATSYSQHIADIEAGTEMMELSATDCMKPAAPCPGSEARGHE